MRTLRTVEELRQALAEFRERYNQRWVVQRHNYLTPEQARQRLLAQVAKITISTLASGNVLFNAEPR